MYYLLIGITPRKERKPRPWKRRQKPHNLISQLITTFLSLLLILYSRLKQLCSEPLFTKGSQLLILRSQGEVGLDP